MLRFFIYILHEDLSDQMSYVKFVFQGWNAVLAGAGSSGEFSKMNLLTANKYTGDVTVYVKVIRVFECYKLYFTSDVNYRAEAWSYETDCDTSPSTDNKYAGDGPPRGPTPSARVT